MNKTTIELHRLQDATAGAGHSGMPFWQDSPSTLDALIDWSQNESNLGRKIYRHVVYSKEENMRHEPHQWNKGGPTYNCKCDYVTYLDIYWQ